MEHNDRNLPSDEGEVEHPDGSVTVKKLKAKLTEKEIGPGVEKDDQFERNLRHRALRYKYLYDRTKMNHGHKVPWGEDEIEHDPKEPLVSAAYDEERDKGAVTDMVENVESLFDSLRETSESN